jgi:Polyketide cyclase / dehydrase and lipid transport
MASYTDSIDIKAPATVVAGILFNLAEWPTWTASVTEVAPLGKDPLEPGVRVRVRQPRLPVAVWTIDAMDDDSFDWSSSSPGLTTAATHRIAGTGVGCTLTLTVTQTGALAGLAGLIYAGLTRRYMRTEAEGLKAAAESAAGAEPLDLDRGGRDADADEQLGHRLGENR